MKIKALTVAACMAALLVGAQTASADSWVRTKGASASFQSYGDKWRVWDTACDGRSVYIRIHHRSGLKEELRFDNGRCGRMQLFNKEYAEGLPIAYKACVSIRFARDHCSNIRGPATWVIDTT